MGANLIVALFMSGAIQTMWGMVNSLQMIVLTVLFSTYAPKNLKIIQISILQLCAFDLFKTEEIY